MIYKFFNSTQLYSVIAIPIVTLVLGIYYFIFPVSYIADNSMPLQHLIMWILPQFPFLLMFLSLILIAIQAIVINNIVTTYEVLKGTYFPALLYVIMIGCTSLNHSINPVLISNIFLLFALNSIFSIHTENTKFDNVFNSGFLISLASLFYFPTICFFILSWIGIALFRPEKSKEFIISLSGLIVPYLFVFVYYFWYDQLGNFIHTHFFSIKLNTPFAIEKKYIPYTLLVGIILFFSLLKVLTGLNDAVIKLRRFRIILFWFLLITIASFFISTESFTTHFTLLAIPLSVHFSTVIVDFRKKWKSELLLWLLILSLIFAQIGDYFIPSL